MRNWEHYSKKCGEETPIETIKVAKDLFKHEDVLNKAEAPVADIQSFMVDTFSNQISSERNKDMKNMFDKLINGLPEVKI